MMVRILKQQFGFQKVFLRSIDSGSSWVISDIVVICNFEEVWSDVELGMIETTYFENIVQVVRVSLKVEEN